MAGVGQCQNGYHIMNNRIYQEIFALNLSKLIIHIFDNGYTCTGGEWWRTPEMALLYAKRGIGILDSLHCRRLAVDLNLFKDGVYLNTSESHKQFGIYWESLHPMNRWGGNFKNSKGEPKPDGNHYELFPNE